MRKSFVMLVLFCIGICTNVLWAQGKVSGVVMDKELNEPLAGVNVLQKGTTIGTVTDFDGKYSLEVGENAILVFSYLSMKQWKNRLTDVLLLMFLWFPILNNWAKLL